eukprot:3195065-Rhodomonas_salina.2
MTDVDGKIAVFGGKTVVSDSPQPAPCSTLNAGAILRCLAALSDGAGHAATQNDERIIGMLEVFDTSTRTWVLLHSTAAGSEPPPRISTAMAAAAGKVFILGGQPGVNATCMGDFHAFDLDANEWMDLAATRCAPLSSSMLAMR